MYLIYWKWRILKRGVVPSDLSVRGFLLYKQPASVRTLSCQKMPQTVKKKRQFPCSIFFVKITLINRLKTAGKLVVKGTAITVKHMCLKAFFLLFFVNTAANMCLIADYTTPKTRRFLKDVRSLESEHL